jgi:hypothetical protein
VARRRLRAEDSEQLGAGTEALRTPIVPPDEDLDLIDVEHVATQTDPQMGAKKLDSVAPAWNARKLGTISFRSSLARLWLRSGRPQRLSFLLLTSSNSLLLDITLPTYEDFSRSVCFSGYADVSPADALPVHPPDPTPGLRAVQNCQEDAFFMHYAKVLPIRWCQNLHQLNGPG